MDPALVRALLHLSASGFSAEADSAAPLCRATRWSPRLALGARHLAFRHGRSRLEHAVKAGDVTRVGWLCDSQAALVLHPAVHEKPPVPGCAYYSEQRPHWPLWPPPLGAHARALARLCASASARPSPAASFTMPPQARFHYGFGPRIEGPLAAWRAANPGALVANVSFRHDLADADFKHLVGVRAVDMRWCTHPGLTDAGLACLRGAHTVWMLGCRQAGVTGAGIASLAGVHTLQLALCTQVAITDAALLSLAGVQVLDLRDCVQLVGEPGALAALRGVRCLYLQGCAPTLIAAARAQGLAVSLGGAHGHSRA